MRTPMTSSGGELLSLYVPLFLYVSPVPFESTMKK